MDDEAMLAHPVARVFSHLAEPSRLADWLPEVSGVQAGAASGAGIGVGFGLRLRRDGQELSGTGEMIAYEPPWSVAYRLRAGAHTHVLRLTCTVAGGATRVYVHQAGDGRPLAVDLSVLRQALSGDGPVPPDTP
ncbi:MAG: SRPBCC family protein [Streptosporangiaceae bacterium]